MSSPETSTAPAAAHESSTKRGLVSRILAVFFDKTSLITLCIKFARVSLAIVALNVVTSLFQQWYHTEDERLDGKLPPLRKFVYIYFAIELAVNMIITLATMVFVDEAITKASLVDYIIGALIAFKFSLTAADLLGDAGRFDYRADGSVLIDTLERLVLSYVLVNGFLPYYLFVRHIIY